MTDAPDTLKKTPLHAIHRDRGARMMAFGGFDMPVQYTSIIEEHKAVRTAAGLFDISHMGEVMVRGPKAFDYVQDLVTNDAGRLYDGRAMYTVMCQPDGGIVDDLIVYRLDPETYMLVINAANIEKDVAWMQTHNVLGATLEDVSTDTALLALQGPEAFAIAQPFTDVDLGDLAFYHFEAAPDGAFMGCDHVLLSHTGYTGEPGLEIYCAAEDAEAIWTTLLDAGAGRGLHPAGLGARDTLRLEAGYCLYGNDITTETNPYEAGLGWVVKPDASDFIGRDALRAIKEEGPRRKLIGFIAQERGIPRHGHDILARDGTIIGTVTSGTQSPMLDRGIGLGYVPNDARYTEPEQPLVIDTGRRTLSVRVTKPPFYDA
jgi:aminomethyltransferase